MGFNPRSSRKELKIKKPPFSNTRALVTREIVRSRDAQCSTGEWPQQYAKHL